MRSLIALALIGGALINAFLVAIDGIINGRVILAFVCLGAAAVIELGGKRR